MTVVGSNPGEGMIEGRRKSDAVCLSEENQSTAEDVLVVSSRGIGCVYTLSVAG